MIYLISGFIFGAFIPYMARRIGKLIPAASGYIWLRLLWPGQTLPWKKLKNNEVYTALFKRYLMRCVGWAIFTSAATILFALNFDKLFTWYYIAFLWILLLLVEIDKRFMLLPDMLTWPLLLLGFVYAAQNGPWLILPEPYVMPLALNSALGACAGYLLPLIASLFIIWRLPEAFGDGDIKLLTAIGAWVGFAAIPYIILGASAIFAGGWLINKRRVAPFGPAIIYAVLIVVILFFAAN